MSKYLDIKDMIITIEKPARQICMNILLDNFELFSLARGSTHLHQAWEGGYIDHVTETMNIGVVIYPALDSLRKLPFSLSDALIVLFLHDIEKPWKYQIIDHKIVQRSELTDKKLQREFRDQKIKDYGLVLTPVQQNALEHVEGEIHDYNNAVRAMNELSSFCHSCDNLSARLWHDFPKRDTWLQS